MKILVTGARGQLGTALYYAAAAYPQHAFSFFDSASLDITDARAVMRAVRSSRAECIINCAAYTQVDRAEVEQSAADAVNHRAAAYLARAAAAQGALLVHISTDYIFDGTANTPYREDAPANPLTAYGRSKLAGELAVRASGCRHIILRTAWLYSSAGHNFLRTILQLLRTKENIQVVFDQVGTPTYAPDLARAVLDIISPDLSGEKLGTFHYTDEGVCSWYDFAQAIRSRAGLTKCSVTPCLSAQFPSPAARPHYSVLDKSKFRETFRLAVPHWYDSLSRCLNRDGRV